MRLALGVGWDPASGCLVKLKLVRPWSVPRPNFPTRNDQTTTAT